MEDDGTAPHQLAKAGDQKRLQPVEGESTAMRESRCRSSPPGMSPAVCLMLPESGAVPGEGDAVRPGGGVLGKQMEE